LAQLIYPHFGRNFILRHLRDGSSRLPIAAFLRNAERRRLVAAGSLPLAGLALLVALMLAGARNPAGHNPPPLDLTQTLRAATLAAAAGPQRIAVTVQRNDNIDRIFRKVGLEMDALAELRSRPEARRVLDLLRPGDIITLTHADGALLSLNRQISDTLTLSISRSGTGYAVSYVENPLETEVVGRRVRIDSSLFQAGKDAGMSAATIMTLATKMFAWDIDFALDIRDGDEFSALYERKVQDGKYVEDGKVLAAEFINQGETHRALWFASQDGKVEGYFTPEGRGMRKAFLRAPLDFTRISSGFNPHRRHPISGVIRAHKGVDYAAPTGTPIWAAGDGRVQFAGRKGGYGNVVIVDHGGGVTTVYGHMSRIGRGIRPGTPVEQGQTIGLVGMTGAATGPHLHYEYLVKGVYKNAAALPLMRNQVPDRYMAEFRRHASSTLARLGSGSSDDRLVASN